MLRFFAATALTFTLAYPAAAWSITDVDAAVRSIEPQIKFMRECVEGLGAKLIEDTETTDLNSDGVDEIILTISGEAGTGASSCFGMVGQDIHLLISDGKGGWANNLGYETHSLVYHPRSDSTWPDIELTGRGFCFPIWRMHDGSYGIWKTCEDGELVFAEGLRDGAVPNGDTMVAGMERTTEPVTVSLDTIEGDAEFGHNGSAMLIDTRNGLIVYKQPKRTIRGAVEAGQVLFRGQVGSSGPVSGIAYVFKKNCPPAPYKVTGRWNEKDHSLILKGSAPRRAESGCAVVGTSRKSDNATLKFTSLKK